MDPQRTQIETDNPGTHPPPNTLITKSVFDVITKALQNKESQKKDDLNLAEQEKRNKFRDGERGEKYKAHFHRLMVAAIYVIGALLIIIVAVRVWHLIAPQQKVWGVYLIWLNERQQYDLERLIFSGIILGFATKYFKYYKIFGGGNKDSLD
jgi:hypothetical protein